MLVICNKLQNYKFLIMKKLFFGITLFLSAAAFAQKAKDTIPNNWHQLDEATTGYYGISLDKAYAFVKTNKLKSKQVIVAVIDSGIDTLHEDLKPILWTNPKEIPGNGIDDDKNGYIDDMHGWNFLGGKDGRNVKEDSHEAARVYNTLKVKYGEDIPDESTLTPAQKAEVEMYKKAKQDITGNINPAEIAFFKQVLPGFLKGDSTIAKELGKEEYNCNDLENYTPTNADAKRTKSFLIQLCKGNSSNEISNKQIIDELQGQLRKADAVDNAPKEYRKEG
jgi:hypothetical protein